MEIDKEKLEKFLYLDNLRESGVTNMFGAAGYLINQFTLNTDEASSILLEWMETYESRQSN